MSRHTRSQPPRQTRNSRNRAEAISQPQHLQRNEETSEPQVEHETIALVVRFIMNESNKKLPVKRSEIVRHCLNGNVKLFANTFQIAGSKLGNIFGIDLVEVEGNKNNYICTSSLPGCSLQELTNEQQRQTDIIYILLTFIFMKGGSVMETNATNFLKKFYQENDGASSYLSAPARISALIDKFVKQLYIKREKVVSETSTSDNKTTLSWGQRASLEISKPDILKSVALLFERPESYFFQQYQSLIGGMDVEETMEITLNE